MIINAKEYGILPNTGLSVLESLNKLINSVKCSATIVLEKGEYILDENEAEREKIYISNTTSEKEKADKTRRLGITIVAKRDIIIDGSGAHFIVVGKLTSILVENSQNITFKNFSIDYKVPTVSEMKIIKASPFKLRCEINADCPYVVRNKKLYFLNSDGEERYNYAQIFDTASGRLWRTAFSPSNTGRCKEISNRIVEISFYKHIGNEGYKAGNIIQMRRGERTEVGVFINLSNNIVFEDVTFNFMHGLGIVGQLSADMRFTRIKCVPSAGRTVSSFADCMHFICCKGLIEVTDSEFFGAHDDVLNVHGVNTKIVEILDDKSFICRYMHKQSYGFVSDFEGDKIEGINRMTLCKTWTAKVVSAELLDEYNMKVVCDSAVPAKMGEAVENITRTADVIYARNKASAIPTRGVLLTTRGKVIVEDNYFDNMGMAGVLVSDDACTWYESGRVVDLTIKNNVFDRCCFVNHRPVVEVLPENLVHDKPVHSGIKVINNRFILEGNTAVFMKSTENIVVKDNVVEGNIGKRAAYKNCSNVSCDM